MVTPVMDTASWARRAGALIVDWLASTLVVVAFQGKTYDGFLVLGVFVLESALFTASVGGSFGQVATRLRVVRFDGDPRPIGVLQALARQVLIALVIPPLVYRPDGRGLHDLAAGSATVTLDTYRAMRGEA